ncbi:glycosyl transferase family group 2-domain-containing protein [Amanita rubescens]|nr:glycosyl transferase family group 2-domain-containing protein [Amanita rubescens]
MDYDSYDASTSLGIPFEENIAVGVCLRVEPGYFRVFPYENPYLAPFEAAVRALNPLVAVKLRTAAVHSSFSLVPEDASGISLDFNTRIQILDSISLLSTADKEQCGAFIRDERVLIVWSDSLDLVVPQCKEFEEKLMKLIWRSRPATSASSIRGTNPSSLSPSPHASAPGGVGSCPKGMPRLLQSLTKRKQGLALNFIASGVAMVIAEFRLDQSFMRFALLAASPFLFCVGLFFALQVIANVSYVIGPVAQFHENSRYYSGTKPDPNPEVDTHLPHVTIEMPVYKESLEETIAPSAGTSAILVHDDGLQLLSEADRTKRVNFYADHNIGWVARPPHSDESDGFKRAGRFKKASNMNYGLRLSLMMEKHLQFLEATGEVDGEEGQLLEDRALELAVEEMFEETGKKWRPWVHNARSLRVGEVILLDCFRDAARELTECPEVAIIQHESDVMQVAHHYFENGIAYFTRRINRCISMGTANGEVAPFVGHNAFLRWSALQDAAFVDQDGIKKIWSESNVSEDFDMALRLQLKGYTIRWATYSELAFKEGVSLTVDDELNRWQKYSYGCNELIFYPMVQWWRKGPINKQLRTFIWSSAPIHYKLSMMSYMFSYYGLAASGCAFGEAMEVDGYYLHSFEIWLACTIVFIGAGNIGYTVPRVPLGFFFFGGLSVHLSTALLSHLFSFNMTWGATKKEVERSNFWKEVPKIFKRFWLALLFSFLSVGYDCCPVLRHSVPYGWRIEMTGWAVIYPLILVAAGHILFPIVLNPWLMIFSY